MGKWELPPRGGHMDLADGIYLQNMTWKEIEERLKKNDLIIVPVGSTEAHGPHAPIGEDTFLVTRMAELVAQKTGCTVAQPVWYGSHPYHHMGMPGTIIVPEEIFIGYLKSIIAGLWNMGFRKQILLNGHGQEYVIPTAIHQWAKTYKLPAVIVNVNWYHAIPQHFKTRKDGGPYETEFIHADEVETSWSMVLFPEMIKQEDAVDTTPRSFLKNPSKWVDKAGNLQQKGVKWYGHVGLGPIEISAYPEGVVGKATLADPEKAKPGVEAFLDWLEEFINEIMEVFPPGKLPPVEEITERDPEEVEQYIKGPLKGGKSIYHLHYPPA